MPEASPEAAPEPQDDPQAHQKPLLTAPEQIAHLKSKGVTFGLCTEADAADYLEHANNYLRAASYRKLYPVKLEGPDAGKYIGLDFAALVALSSADRVLRSSLREICIDVEHFARVELINRCVHHGEDGYEIVSGYLEHQRARGNTRVESTLKSRSSKGKYPDAYSGDLISHYLDDLGGLSIWTLLEVTDFGQFADLWLFCANRWGDKDMVEIHYVLKSVKTLRNACSHNSCIVNGFTASAAKSGYPTPEVMLASMNAHGVRNGRSRKAKLANLRIAQIAAALFASSIFCTRSSTRKRHAEAMGKAGDAIARTAPLQPSDGSLASYFDFLLKLVDIWTPRLP